MYCGHTFVFLVCIKFLTKLKEENSYFKVENLGIW